MMRCFSGGMPMPVSVTSNATTVGAWSRTGWPAIQPPVTAAMLSCTPPCSVNLKALDSRFFSTCCRRLVSVVMLRSAGSTCTLNDRPRLSASWRNGRVTVSCRFGQQDLLGIDRHRAGFDLRQIENVADQVEQIGAGAVDGARELDLSRRQVAVRIVAKLLAQDQDRVQRRAQLVRHVGQEFGLVLRGQRQFRRLLLQRAACLLDLLVLALHLDVLLGELLRLLLELFVGLLQLALLRLQFGGELLRLLQQALGLHRRLDRVQHDADAGGELLEERDLQIGERADRGQLDHRLHLAFEQHRQHDDVVRRRLEQAGADRHHVGRQAGDQHAPAVDGALADQPLPHAQMLGMARRSVVGVGGEQLADAALLS